MKRTLNIANILLYLLISSLNNAVEGRPGKELFMHDSKAEGSALAKYEMELKSPQEKISTMWPLGFVNYRIDFKAFPQDASLLHRVRQTMKYIESKSCVRFRPITVTDEMSHAWLDITNPKRQRECSHEAKLSKNKAVTIILGLDCLSWINILHTLLHGIGFKDEVTHPHRDQYVRIQWDNIQPRYRHLFGIVPDDSKVLVEYDPMSAMHFHDRAFSRNGKATIAAKMPGLQIQPSDHLSQLDIKKLLVTFEHECNRRKADDLLQSCNSVLQNKEDNANPVPKDKNKINKLIDTDDRSDTDKEKEILNPSKGIVKGSDDSDKQDSDKPDTDKLDSEKQDTENNQDSVNPVHKDKNNVNKYNDMDDRFDTDKEKKLLNPSKGKAKGSDDSDKQDSDKPDSDKQDTENNQDSVNPVHKDKNNVNKLTDMDGRSDTDKEKELFNPSKGIAKGSDDSDKQDSDKPDSDKLDSDKQDTVSNQEIVHNTKNEVHKLKKKSKPLKNKTAKGFDDSVHSVHKDKKIVPKLSIKDDRSDTTNEEKELFNPLKGKVVKISDDSAHPVHKDKKNDPKLTDTDNHSNTNKEKELLNPIKGKLVKVSDDSDSQDADKQEESYRRNII